jgi:hypothetical protein
LAYVPLQEYTPHMVALPKQNTRNKNSEVGLHKMDIYAYI